ncbi:adenosine deaminase family protein [Ottowia sp.]|uniref:adenosine deaminase family protein n=1 Tax=Ottowia sp. TaxID=1898956 RepID=UPI0039E2606F
MDRPADANLTAFLRAIPKVELHAHLLGTVRHQTFAELAERAGAPLTREEIDGFYTRDERPKGILHVLRALDSHLIRTPEDLHRITFEYLEDAAAHSVRHAEFFWNPTGTVQHSGMAYADAQDAIVRAIGDAERAHGIAGRLVPSIDREAPPEAAVEMVRWMLDHRHPWVVGIGIDYRENDRPPEMFAEAYALARAAGLKTTAHAGEFGMPWTNVQTALDLLKVDRIDHGYTAIDNPAFARACAERGVVFTVVPTNSYYLRTLPPERWALDHPIRHMPALGLRIHPNTDDPTLHKVTPTEAWFKMVRDFGFSLDDLRGFMLNGLDGAWMDDALRAQWRTEWPVRFDELRARLLPDWPQSCSHPST